VAALHLRGRAAALLPLLLFFRVDPAVYSLLGMLVMPDEWMRELFGWSVLSAAPYFALFGGLLAARFAGVFRWTSFAMGRRPAQHKRLRAEWAAQFAPGSAASAAVKTAA
jgi:hypothetical protein